MKVELLAARATRSVARVVSLAGIGLVAMGIVDSRTDAAFAAETSGKTRIVLVAGGPSHGYFAHTHFAGCTLLARALGPLEHQAVEAQATGTGQGELGRIGTCFGIQQLRLALRHLRILGVQDRERQACRTTAG